VLQPFTLDAGDNSSRPEAKNAGHSKMAFPKMQLRNIRGQQRVKKI
jgi:hypothetical protein